MFDPGDALPFIILNPFLETSLELLNLCLGNLKLHADVEEVNKVDKVVIVLWLLEPVSQEDWGKVQCPE